MNSNECYHDNKNEFELICYEVMCMCVCVCVFVCNMCVCVCLMFSMLILQKN